MWSVHLSISWVELTCCVSVEWHLWAATADTHPVGIRRKEAGSSSHFLWEKPQLLRCLSPVGDCRRLDRLNVLVQLHTEGRWTPWCFVTLLTRAASQNSVSHWSLQSGGGGSGKEWIKQTTENKTEPAYKFKYTSWIDLLTSFWAQAKHSE